MNTIGFRNRFYQARQTWPQLDPPKASAPPQAANEPRTGESNEQSPPPATREASRIEVFRQHLEAGLTSAEDIAREMGVSKGTVSKWATKAIGAGWLKKNGRQYALVR